MFAVYIQTNSSVSDYIGVTLSIIGGGTRLLPGEGHTVVGREHLVELSGAVTAWFDRWL